MIGNNAQGKTNLLEAVFFAAYGKSFRTTKDIELITYDGPFLRVFVEYEKENRIQTIEIMLRKDKQKQILYNGVPLKKTIDLIGCMNVVLFSPEDLRLIKGGPSERRRFIDREISHLNRVYMDNLLQYHKILNQRNQLLKQAQYKKSLIETIDLWDEQLLDVGMKIIKKRILYTEQLSKITKATHLKITDGKEHIELQYFSSIAEQSTLDYDKIAYGFREKLKKNIDKDIRYGYTQVGPHKDDLVILINGIDARKYGSQGQQRTAALSLKLSEIELIENEIGERPILLLDDVMSELDVTRQQMLMHAVKGLQTILTTTDINGLDQREMAPFKLIEIADGTVIESREVTHVD